jgi:hypothetical protein
MGASDLAQRHFQPGSGETLESSSPTRAWMSVFEDDGQTGYLYALDRERSHANKIVDAVQIYTTTENYGDDDRPWLVAKVVWSPDGDRSALEIDGRMLAAIDFANRVTYSLGEFPPAPEGWRHAKAESIAAIRNVFSGGAV